jgi:hypothetical protein
MTFIARIIRFLFWLLILSWSVALLRRIVGWMLRGMVSSAQSTAGSVSGVAGSDMRKDATSGSQGSGNRRLVRDPVCGVHVAEVLAIPLREGDEVTHFCSTACRDAYLGNAKKFAANG